MIKVLTKLLRCLNDENKKSKEKSKVLLFSYSVKLLDFLQTFVVSECYTFLRIDGNTNSQKRVELVNKFNKDENLFLFLISTK